MMDFKRNIIITGGAGFIGSHVVRLFVNKYPEYRIINIDKLTYAGNLENLKDIEERSNYRFVKADICDYETMLRIMTDNQVDGIIHLAAESHVDRSIADASAFLRTNVLGTQVLLDAAKRTGIKRFHQVSTDEVYGDWPFDSSETFSETSPLKPSSPYAASKASADLLVLAYHRTYGLPVTISRCSNNYGPYQYPEKLIPAMVYHALKDESLPVYGSGLNVRDWLYVEDHCRAIDVILQKGSVGEIYNIGTNEEFTNLAVIETILAQLDKPKTLITHVADRLGHDRRYATNADKLKALGWVAQHRFADAFAHTVQWYVEHPKYWD